MRELHWICGGGVNGGMETVDVGEAGDIVPWPFVLVVGFALSVTGIA